MIPPPSARGWWPKTKGHRTNLAAILTERQRSLGLHFSFASRLRLSVN